ncbi:hypothetical protein NONI108955_04110 [Nocardia ninae]|uniref:Uncharacterized protein n=1 Tax=Nocardia ninae NBRC 108245 TaxID=1210091 RepID=A0A511MI18_9NOCA|nr:hypothetical protein [Nocardia ninae]GEM40285.1 hypothetical protein NN4_48040 [Nocardia ninae NBRC 108245]
MGAEEFTDEARRQLCDKDTRKAYFDELVRQINKDGTSPAPTLRDPDLSAEEREAALKTIYQKRPVGDMDLGRHL